jgi:hypothetical protein
LLCCLDLPRGIYLPQGFNDYNILNCNPDAKEFFSPFSFSLPLLEHLLVKLSPEERLHDEYGTHELRRGMQNQTDNWVESMPRRETISLQRLSA